MSKPERTITAQGPAATPPGEISLPLLQDLASVPGLTRQVQEFLSAHGVDEEKAINIRIALAEACNNAIQHTLSDQPGDIRASIRDGTVTIIITDHTPGFDLPGNAELPEPSSEHGRGLFLIRKIMDRMEYRRGTAENKLVMSCKVAAG